MKSGESWIKIPELVLRRLLALCESHLEESFITVGQLDK